MNKSPTLTVVMPVYNGEKYIKEAIDSILDQTYKDFEFIIINDGSSDSSSKIIQSYSDERIRFINNKKNSGVAFSRNVGLKEARGEFLTWCDCDDLSHPSRLEKQIRFLRENPHFDICGTWLKRFGGEVNYVQKADSDPEILRATLIFKPSVPNATAMLRMDKIRKFKLLYKNNLPVAEDYDFIFRCSKHLLMTNIEEILYEYRASETSIMKKYTSEKDTDLEVHRIVYSEILDYLGFQPTQTKLFNHRMISSTKIFDDFDQYRACFMWLKEIGAQNNKTQLYESRALNKVIAEQFYFMSKKASKFGLSTLFFYLKNSFRMKDRKGLIEITKLAIRCFLKYDKFNFSLNNS